jgi:hypothetical protein
MVEGKGSNGTANGGAGKLFTYEYQIQSLSLGIIVVACQVLQHLNANYTVLELQPTNRNRARAPHAKLRCAALEYGAQRASKNELNTMLYGTSHVGRT